jgi:glutamyl-tRNA synthetase
MIRVRFAPSPTGFLHIGGARTAVFNWLYAKAKKGTFVLRIEDTDAARSKPEYLEEIEKSLQWLGFNWDEIYYQSQRFGIYKEHAERLLREGKAYAETSEKGTAIIFKVQPQLVILHDVIRGDIQFDSVNIKDQVLLKSDGTPTYNFACVVDDALMNITHVIRGDDHISNTPKQILLYQALGFALPVFAHLPLIMGMEGGRLSKRTGATAISEYRAMGYLAPALVNYLLLLSWSPGDDREVIDLDEAVQAFDISGVSKTAATFDIKKLEWVNNEYIKKTPPDVLRGFIAPLLQGRLGVDPEFIDPAYFASLIQLYQARLTTINDFVDRADFFFLTEPIMDPQAQDKHLNRDLSREFGLFISRLEVLAAFDIPSIEQAFRELVVELNIESKALIHPIRVALTGKTVGPGLFEVIYYLGQQRTKERLLKWIKRSGAA